jgi:hypothetical protein
MPIDEKDFEIYIQTLEKRLIVLKEEIRVVEADLLKAREVSEKFKFFKLGGSIDSTSIKEDSRKKFEGLSIRKCLQLIAKEHNNILNLGEARIILHQAGRMTKNLSADIVRNPEFVRSEKKGIYHFDETKLDNERNTTYSPVEDWEV